MATVASTAWLRCTAGSGMFPYEAGVLIRGVDRCWESMVDRQFVRCPAIPDDGQVPALLRVKIVAEHGAKVLVELPRQVVAGGRRIWVLKTEVPGDGHFVEAGDCVQTQHVATED